ncbi:MAG: hypothetical protein LBC73_09515 [Oscillospiraceae bacterium]|jgi:hypothetical protein|nr:hypothetical protein [Oscillospiraceae bacterium]
MTIFQSIKQCISNQKIKKKADKSSDKLKSGDILIFVAGDAWISKAIALLTGSNVSHTAIMSSDKQMVEMIAKGITCSNVEKSDSGVDVYQLRHTAALDYTPVVSATQKYIHAETVYNFPALALLAGLIIYRKLRPTSKLIKIVDMILYSACIALDNLIQKIMKYPSKAMVCSQLVYQIYEDCAKIDEKYHIKINNGLLQKHDNSNKSDGYVSFIDLAKDVQETEMTSLETINIPDEDELYKELYEALTDSEKADDQALETVDFGTLPVTVKRFMDKTNEFLIKAKCEIPLDALFITPADYLKAENLVQVDKTKIR